MGSGRAWLAGGVVLAAVMTGCGGSSSGGHAAPPSSSSPTPSSVPSGQPNGIGQASAAAAVQRVIAAAAAQSSVHVIGTVEQQGMKLRLDVRAGTDSGEGTLRIGGGRLDLRLVSGTLYIRGDKAGLEATGAARKSAKLAAGKWVKQALTGDAGTANLLLVPKLFQQIFTGHGTLTKGKDVTVNGVPAYQIVDSTRGGALYVRTLGDPLPVKLVNAHNQGSVSFDEYGAPLTVTAPAHALNG